MQPNDTFTAQPAQPETTPNPFPPATPPPVSPTPTPEKKSHKKLIILLVIGGVILLAGLVITGLIAMNILKSPSPKTTSNTSEVWTNNPEELYYDNASLLINSPISYKEANDNQKKLVLDGGKQICESLKSDKFQSDEKTRITSIIYGAFATTPGSICPENANILEDAAKQTDADAFYYKFGQSLLFDNTVSFNDLSIAQNVCFIQAALIFGTNATTDIKESQRQQQLACASFRGHFKTDLEYFNWARESEDEVDQQLISTAKALDLYTGICAPGGVKCS